MSIELFIDMNLSPDWVDELSNHGWSSAHWSAIGDPRASDREIMQWARSNAHVVFTHDLDFGTMLALTHASGPSVIQVRGQNVLPDHMAPIIVAALQQYETELAGGALLVVDESKLRLRILPIGISRRIASNYRKPRSLTEAARRIRTSLRAAASPPTLEILRRRFANFAVTPDGRQRPRSDA